MIAVTNHRAHSGRSLPSPRVVQCYYGNCTALLTICKNTALFFHTLLSPQQMQCHYGEIASLWQWSCAMASCWYCCRLVLPAIISDNHHSSKRSLDQYHQSVSIIKTAPVSLLTTPHSVFLITAASQARQPVQISAVLPVSITCNIPVYWPRLCLDQYFARLLTRSLPAA